MVNYMEAILDNRQIVFVEFQGARRGKFIYDSEEEDTEIQRGEQVIVETPDGGEDVGLVTHICETCLEEQSDALEVLRKLGPADYAHLIDNQEKEEEAWNVCEERVEALGLEMKLTDVEFQFDRKKVTFYYTADHRVDFRQLVRDLAAVYRTRIEMRQIGARDEAKRYDGMGLCGNRICCSAFIEDFDPVNTQLAKDQGLPMNPSKLTGLCGKLKCCLRYEHNYYEENLDRFPKVGETIKLPEGEVRVTAIDIFNDIVHLWAPNQAEMMEKPLAEIDHYIASNKQ